MTGLANDLRLSARTFPGFAAIGLFWGSFAATIPDIKSSLGMSDGIFGTAMLAGAIGAIGAMWAAPAIDKRIGANAPVVAALLAAVAFAGVAGAGSVALFVVAIFFAGLGTGLLDVLVNIRVAAAESSSGRSLMNLNHAGYSLIYGIAAASMAVPREAGIAPLWVFLGIALIVAGLSTRMKSRVETGDDDTGPSGMGGFNQVAIWTGIITLIGFLAENATEGWSALHVERTLGGRAAEGALGPAVLGLTMFAGRFAGHLLTIRGKEGRVIVVAALVCAAGAALASVATAPWMAYLGFGILGLGVSVTAPLAFSLAGRLAPPGKRAVTVSRCSLLGFTGFFIGPPLMGWISEALTLRAAFGWIAVLTLLMPLALLALSRTTSSRLQNPSG